MSRFSTTNAPISVEKRGVSRREADGLFLKDYKGHKLQNKGLALFVIKRDQNK